MSTRKILIVDDNVSSTELLNQHKTDEQNVKFIHLGLSCSDKNKEVIIEKFKNFLKGVKFDLVALSESNWSLILPDVLLEEHVPFIGFYSTRVCNDTNIQLTYDGAIGYIDHARIDNVSTSQIQSVVKEFVEFC